LLQLQNFWAGLPGFFSLQLCTRSLPLGFCPHSTFYLNAGHCRHLEPTPQAATSPFVAVGACLSLFLILKSEHSDSDLFLKLHQQALLFWRSPDPK
jgi:hypothetical protein